MAEITRSCALITGAARGIGRLLAAKPAEAGASLVLFWTARAFLPNMQARDSGHVVTIASAAGLAATSKLTVYCASKFAAVGFDESLRVELRRMNCKVVTTVICPFYPDTGMFAGARTRIPWLLPILKPDLRVWRIVRAIERDRRRLVVPWLVCTSWPAGCYR